MRILLVTNGLRYGGAERIIEALAVDLTEGGDTVSVIATTRGGPIRDALKARNIPVSVLHISSRVDARVPLKLALVARKFRPDVIHSHLAVADIATALARPLVPGARLVTTVHNSGIELDPLKKALWRFVLPRFDQVLAVSERVRSSLGSGVQAQVVRPSLVVAGAPALDRQSAREALGVTPETLLVVAAGRLTPIKGYDVLREAATHIRTRDVRFIVIGEGEERQRLEGGALELIGPREDAAALLAAADVVACPSRSEGLPQIPIEAMAAARPVVASDVGGTPEVVIDRETGLLIPPDDPAALAAALDTLLGDLDYAARLGAAGRARLDREGLSRSRMVARTREAYLHAP